MQPHSWWVWPKHVSQTAARAHECTFRHVLRCVRCLFHKRASMRCKMTALRTKDGNPGAAPKTRRLASGINQPAAWAEGCYCQISPSSTSCGWKSIFSTKTSVVLPSPPSPSADSLFVRGKQAIPESQSGIRELHGQVSRCREPPCRSLNVHMCAALLSHLQDRWFITGEPQGQGPCQWFCCHGSRCWKERISFQCRLQMLGRGLDAAALCSSRFVIYRRTREQETCVGFSDLDPTLTHTLPFNNRKRTFATWNVAPC